MEVGFSTDEGQQSHLNSTSSHQNELPTQTESPLTNLELPNLTRSPPTHYSLTQIPPEAEEATAGAESTSPQLPILPVQQTLNQNKNSSNLTTSTSIKQQNDANLIMGRRFNFNHKLKRNFELMCEDKISRSNKLEEIHFSLPSSIKSTFIMTFSPDGQRVASTHNDHRIYICDLQTGKLLDTLEGHPKTPWCLAWHPSNKEILASGCLAGEVRVWDLRSKACESWTSSNNTIIASLDFHPKERILVIATSNDIQFWDWSEPEPFAKTTTTHDKEKVKFVEFDSSGTKLITGISNSPKYTSGFANLGTGSGNSFNNSNNNSNNINSSGSNNNNNNSNNINNNSDSLQNRIIDNYIINGSLEQIQPIATENMTQNSETVTNFLHQNHHQIHLHNNSNNQTAPSLSDSNVVNLNERNQIPSPQQQQQQQQNDQQQFMMQNNNNNQHQSQQLMPGSEHDLTYRSTLTQSRIASIYRQLESIEDSMRHTSYAPYVGPNQSGVEPMAVSDTVESRSSTNSQVNSASAPCLNQPIVDSVKPRSVVDPPTTVVRPGNQEGDRNETQNSNPVPVESSSVSSDRNTPTDRSLAITHFENSTTEPSVVSFDESLEQLQLPLLVVAGQVINFSTVVEQFPLDLPWQLHYMMQFDSINQVNQTFIRISKLMSSVRLYRQVVQQILSSGNSGQAEPQPNQIITAQGIGIGRHTSNIPIVVHNCPVLTQINDLNSGEVLASRSTDPIMAIQFRNTARNVPLTTLCKITLLSSRAICIMRSQQLIEQSFASIRIPASYSSSNNQRFMTSNSQSAASEVIGGQANQQTNLLEPNSNIGSSNSGGQPSYYLLLNQLHELLTIATHALTTSNIHTHISNLRTLINNLLTVLSSFIRSQEEARRLNNLIHKIAHSLTGRSWDGPLGTNLNDIRLDLIHTLCTVDLTLHLTRQIQWLQMQRLCVMVRIDEFRRLSSGNPVGSSPDEQQTVPTSIASGRSATSAVLTTATSTTTTTTTTAGGHSQYTISPERFYGPSTSRESINTNSNVICGGNNKRKEFSTSSLTAATTTQTTDSSSSNNDQTKRIKLDQEGKSKSADQGGKENKNNLDTQMIDTSTDASSNGSSVNFTALDATLSQAIISAQQNSANLSDSSQTADRLVLWNSPNSQLTAEQSLQRLLVTASSMSNSHILLRIYSRSHGNQAISTIPPQPNIIDHSTITTTSTLNQPHNESRRRALSQDTDFAPQQTTEQTPLTGTVHSRDANVVNQQLNYQHNNQHQNHHNNHHQHYNLHRARQIHVYPSPGAGGLSYGSFERQPHLHVYQTRGSGQHLWFNQWTIPLPVSNSNYRIQCWDFSLSALPNIKDSQANLITQKCRIHNDSSIDISSNGCLLACLVPRDDSAFIPNFDMKIFSLRTVDFGTCYYKLRQNPSAISVSFSPSASYVVVGLASNKFVSNDQTEDELSIGIIYKLSERIAVYVRDIKIKKNDAALSLNAIRWLSRGIVYNVGPQHHQRYHAGRLRNRNIA